MNEIGLLSAVVFDRVAYEAINEYLSPEELTAHGAAIFEEVANYYQIDAKAEACDPKILQERITRRLPKQTESFSQLFREMDPRIGTTNIVKDVLEIKRRAAGDELVMALAQGTSPSDIQDVLSTYTSLNEATDLIDAGGGVKLFDTSLSRLVIQSADPENLIRLLPLRLNTAMRGGVLPGHTVVIIGRVNVGKSALAVHNIGGFLRQDKTVLLIENEDLVDDVVRRVGCRLVGRGLDWAEANPTKFEDVAMSRGLARLIVPDPVPTTIKEVDRIAGMLKPDIIVVNQLRHLAADKAVVADGTGAIDRVAQHLRALGKRRRILMVLVGAALEGERDRDGLAIEKAVLEMSDSYGSRTGVPGIADALITIGTNSVLKQQGKVVVHLAKNKRGGAEPTLYCHVNLETCVFKEI